MRKCMWSSQVTEGIIKVKGDIEKGLAAAFHLNLGVVAKLRSFPLSFGTTGVGAGHMLC